MMKLFRSFSLYFESGFCSLVGPGKKKGEDAFYASTNVLSVADGVGGWTLSGIDPSKYAWELMKNVEKESQNRSFSAFEILNRAAGKTKEVGSSTCVLILLDPEGKLIDTINVGDSGFFLYRFEEDELNLVNRSQEVLHGFNFPFQLGTDGDSASTGHKQKVHVKKDDLILVYSDGISDNLFEEKIREIVREGVKAGKDLKGIATDVADSAVKVSVDDRYFSPFAKAASAQFLQKYIGGKPDDSTVILARVCEN